MVILSSILIIVAAIIYANFVEWAAHKYFLHGLGKNKDSIFSFHWHNHHKVSRTYKMIDREYELPLWHKSRRQEPIILIALAVLHFFLFFISPLAYLTLIVYIFVYFNIHKFCHTEIGNAKKYFRWHYDHHCRGKQDFNWCVVFPLADIIMGTYKNKDDFK